MTRKYWCKNCEEYTYKVCPQKHPHSYAHGSDGDYLVCENGCEPQDKPEVADYPCLVHRHWLMGRVDTTNYIEEDDDEVSDASVEDETWFCECGSIVIVCPNENCRYLAKNGHSGDCYICTNTEGCGRALSTDCSAMGGSGHVHPANFTICGFTKLGNRVVELAWDDEKGWVDA